MPELIRVRHLLLATLFFIGTSSAQADIAYSNIVDGDSFGGGGFNVGFFDPINNNIHLAFEFTSSATGSLEGIDVAAALANDGGTDSMEWALWGSSGSAPGVIIWSDTINPISATNSLFSMSGGATAPVLQAGTSYWLSARSLNGVDSYLWGFNLHNAFGDSANDNIGGTNWNMVSGNFQSAFRVSVSAVPEPSMMISLVGLGLLAISRRRRVV